MQRMYLTDTHTHTAREGAHLTVPGACVFLKFSNWLWLLSLCMQARFAFVVVVAVARFMPRLFVLPSFFSFFCFFFAVQLQPVEAKMAAMDQAQSESQSQSSSQFWLPALLLLLFAVVVAVAAALCFIVCWKSAHVLPPPPSVGWRPLKTSPSPSSSPSLSPPSLTLLLPLPLLLLCFYFSFGFFTRNPQRQLQRCPRRPHPPPPCHVSARCAWAKLSATWQRVC